MTTMSKKILAENLAGLMAHKQIKSARSMSLAPNCDVSDRMIGHVLNQTATPTIDVVDKLAEYFKVPTWGLLVDGIAPADLQNGQLMKLVNGFLNSTAEGREILSKIADRELDYATVNEPAFPSRAHRVQKPARNRRKNES